VARLVDDSQARIRETIVTHMPKEAEITRIEFEGPRLAIYVKNVGLLLEQSYVVTDIVNLLHKRVVIRSDPSIRHTETESERLIKGIVPPEAEITEINFDPTLGEVIIEAKKPGLAIGKDGSTLSEIIKSTSWRPRVLRAPPLPSKIIASTRHILHSESEDRSRILRDVGERIFRPRINRTSSVYLTPLGGFHEVGRSAILVRTEESCVMLDCGISAGANEPITEFPRVDSNDFDIDNLDAVIISHAHLDHCGFVPFLFKYGYDGPIYCSEPTSVLMTLLQLDYLDVSSKEGGYPPYDQKDVREAVMHSIPVKYGVVTDVAPDIKLTLHNAGHIIGSSIIHLHIGEGLHNIVYSVDGSDPITVVDPEGRVQITRIGDLVDHQMHTHNPSGGFVEKVLNVEGWKTFAFNPSTYELETVPITSFMRHPISEELFEINTSTGRKTRVTGSHSVFTVRNGQIAAARVRDLRRGDYLVGAGVIPNFAQAKALIELDEKEFRVFEDDPSKLRRLLEKYASDVERTFPQRKREILRWVREHFERGAYRSAIAKMYHAKASRVRSIFRELGITDSPRLKACLPRHFKITPQFSRFLGYFASEGSIQGNTVVITNYDEKLRDDCRKTILPIFNSGYFEDQREIRFHSHSLRKLLGLLGSLGTAYTKRVPSIILSGPESNVSEFLRGYFEGDGSLRVRSTGCSISAGSKSQLLLQDVSFLLLRLGIPVTFEYNRASKMHIITIYGLDNIARFLENVKIEEWSRALIAVNPKRRKNPLWNRTPIAALSPELQARVVKTAYRYAKSMGRDRLETLLQFGDERDTIIAHAPFIYDEVKTIRKTKPTRPHVYDLSVEGYENFLGGLGFLFLHNSGDFKFGRTMLLEPATCSFPRAETLIMESTYGGPDDVMSDRETVEGKLARIVNETAEKGGKILIPTLAVGRAQEIMLVLNSYMKSKQIKELPIFLEGMISEATAIHTAFPEYLARDLRDQILYKDINPFQSDYFSNVDHPSDREKIAAGEPAIILATSGMMEGGPAIDYFRYLASDERNALVFVSYQVEGTLGNRLKNGGREVSLMGRNGKVEAYKVNLRVESVEGFSGHSDRNQLFGFLKRISPRPSRVVLGHGERRKTDLFAHQVSRILKLRTVAPDNLETLRLR
jgi:predicted metal-dependent RNase/intein/homing endonuclease